MMVTHQQILPSNLLMEQSTMMHQSTPLMPRARETLECMGRRLMTILLRDLTVMTQPSTCHISLMSRVRKDQECTSMTMTALALSSPSTPYMI